ncbi:MAG: M48 family metallopeptidase [Lentimicrobiaceae bacterium]|nr:M48 family metallopeptidase [Lentimicrobiaceae bacterium]
MYHNKIRIPFEQQLGHELFETLEGDILIDIMEECKVESLSFDYHQILQGHSFKASPVLAPGLFGVFQEVKETLEFDETLDFYINNSPELNAFALASNTPEKPHIINLNSGLVHMLNDRELRFVVGHEIGHIISRNANITSLINFVFPEGRHIPALLQHKINLWGKLSELTADRYGFIACNDVAACISGFFKITCGLNSDRVEFNYEAYFDENERILAMFRETGAGNALSHPINPIRIKAIELFASSELFKNLSKEEEPPDDEHLNQAITELTDALMILSNTPLDLYRKQFIATGGLIMAGMDEQMNEDETEAILNTLSGFTIFPMEYLQSVLHSGKVTELFEEAIQKILEINPGDRYSMLNMLINIAHSDHRITKPEIAFLYNIGTKTMGMSRKEIAQFIAENVQKSFNPQLYGGG